MGSDIATRPPWGVRRSCTQCDIRRWNSNLQHYFSKCKTWSDIIIHEKEILIEYRFTCQSSCNNRSHWLHLYHRSRIVTLLSESVLQRWTNDKLYRHSKLFLPDVTRQEQNSRTSMLLFERNLCFVNLMGDLDRSRADRLCIATAWAQSVTSGSWNYRIVTLGRSNRFLIQSQILSSHLGREGG